MKKVIEQNLDTKYDTDVVNEKRQERMNANIEKNKMVARERAVKSQEHYLATQRDIANRRLNQIKHDNTTSAKHYNYIKERERSIIKK